MTRDEAVDLLMGRMGKRTDTALRDLIIAEIAFVQEYILEQAPELPWFLLKASSGLTTAASTQTVALPTDFLMEWEDGGLWLTKSDGDDVLLVRDDWDILRENTAIGEEGDEGQPTHYDIVGETIYLRNTPDAAYALSLLYYGAATSLAGTYGDAADIENSWLKYAADWLMAETGVIIANQYLQSQSMVQLFAAQAEQAKRRVKAKNVAMMESSKQRSMGDD